MAVPESLSALSDLSAGSPAGQAIRPLAFGWRLLLSVGVGALFFLCFPPVGLPLLLPLAVAAFLALLDGVTTRQAFYLGLACGFTLFGSALFWLTNLFGTAAIGLWFIAALFPALFAELTVWLRRRLPSVPLWLLAPIVWTGVEYFRSEPMIPNFAWMGLGYAVVNVPALAAVASVFGSYGLTFGIVALGAILLSGRKAWGLLLFWGLLFLIPRTVPTPNPPLKVRLVQANSEDEDSLFGMSERTAGERADVIVWPEYSFVSDPRQTPGLWPRLARVPQDNRCYFLFGAKDAFDPADSSRFRNTAFLLAPDGRLIGKHVKNHPVHFIRDGVAGTEARAFSTDVGRLGVAICFDMDFPDVARRLTDDGAEALLVPSDNPQEWGPIQRSQHRQLFQMRAAECGRWLATADVAGSTFVVAPTGKVTQSVSITDTTVLDATLGRETGRTLYVRGGWRFGQACLLALVTLCLAALRAGRRRGRSAGKA